MKQIIRHSVFETNSSSTHTISISSTECSMEFLRPDRNGVLQIYPGEFGWGPEVFTDATTKASYCLTYVKDCHNKELDYMLRTVLLKATGASEVEFVPLNDNNWGYIDHQSCETCSEAFDSPTKLYNFIFNPNSELSISNDNE